MKSIKIKLGYSNQSKEDGLLAVFKALDYCQELLKKLDLKQTGSTEL